METVYQYDNHGYYVGETIAYHGLPHNCTKTKPKYQKGYIPQWVNSSWKQIEDHRQQKDDKDCVIENTGTAYWLPDDTWTSAPRYMTEPGPLPQNVLLTKPEQNPIEALKEAKRIKLLEIHAKHDAVLMDLLLTETSKDNTDIRTTLIEQRATLEKQLQQATTVEEVEAITISYTL